MVVYNTSDDLFGVTSFIVDATAGQGNYQTIGAAITAASAGVTIFIRPGTYTENITLKAGVNLSAFGSDSSFNATGVVIINGTCTLSTAGSVSIFGIQLQTNSAALLTVSGSVASIVNLNNCYLNCSNTTGISFSSSSSSSQITANGCAGNIGTTGIALFAHSSTGTLNFMYSQFTNTGGSSTANTISSGSLNTNFSIFLNPITTSGTAICGLGNGTFVSSAPQNIIAFTSGGSGAHSATQSSFSSGTASAISISNTLIASLLTVSSTNTNAITGAGTLQNAGISFNSSSSKINTTTQSAFNFDVGGISFDGGTNILSAYTVGTFFPTMIGTVAGTTTYSVQAGFYVRVGAVVTIQSNIVGSAATGTGNVIVAAFPFTIKNQTNGNVIGPFLGINASGWTYPASTTAPVVIGGTNTTQGNIYVNGSAAASAVLQMANAAFNFTYVLTHEI